jgi:hypothetical protein
VKEPRYTVGDRDGYPCVIDNRDGRYSLFNHSAAEAARMMNEGTYSPSNVVWRFV